MTPEQQKTLFAYNQEIQQILGGIAKAKDTLKEFTKTDQTYISLMGEVADRRDIVKKYLDGKDESQYPMELIKDLQKEYKQAVEAVAEKLPDQDKQLLDAYFKARFAEKVGDAIRKGNVFVALSEEMK